MKLGLLKSTSFNNAESKGMQKYPAHEQMKTLTAITAKYLPYHGAKETLTAVRVPEWRLIDHPEATPREIPVPTAKTMRKFATEELYLNTGERCFKTLKQMTEENGWSLGPDFRVLDFGCAAGRVTRWFLDHLRGGGEVWGADLDSPCIHWAQQHLSPPFRFIITSTFPHLPFEERSFDLITAWSVFTHIDDLTDVWLLELRRILSDRGAIYITVNDDASIRALQDPKWAHTDDFKVYDEAVKNADLSTEDFMSVSFAIAPYSRMYHNRRYLVERLSLYFDVAGIMDEAWGYQSAYLLRRKQ